MKKKEAAALAAWLLALNVGAAPLSQEAARQAALRFVSARQGEAGARGADAVAVRVEDAGISADGSLYVFNIGRSQGYVVVSGDDCTGELILGYADHGTVSAALMPPNLRAWLQGYADQVSWLKAHGPRRAGPAAATRAAAVPARTAVSPLVQSRWDQDEPYNNYCPTVGNGSKKETTATGCVATAAAQLMYYYGRHVVAPRTTTTLTAIPSYRTASLRTRIAEKPVRTFDWTKMADTYPTDDSEATEQVARLMEYVGAGVKMDYNVASEGGSGAYSSDVPAMLKNYFGYDRDVTLIRRNDFSYGAWIDAIYRELTQRGPVYYGGTSTGGGHAFLIDGYSEEDYFHVNWGWGGASDGYFKLSVLYSEQQGIGGSTSNDGFSLDQEAIVNVWPEDNGTTDAAPQPDLQRTSVSGNLALVGTATVGSPVSIRATVTNQGQGVYSGDLMLYRYGGYLSSDELLANCQVEIAPGATGDIMLKFTPTETGRYQLRLYDTSYKVVASASVNVSTPTATTGTLTADGADLTFSNGAGSRYSDGFYGTQLEGQIKVKNTSASTAHTSGVVVELWEHTHDNWYSYSQGQLCPASIAAGGTDTVSFTFDGLTRGQSYFLYFLDINDEELLQTYAFESKYGVTTFAADGTVTTVRPTADVTVAADALALDLTGVSGVRSVTPNRNPNTLYVVGSNSVSGLDGCNVVRDGAADALTLADGYGFYAPVAFTAARATYRRTFTTGADGRSGWSTLMVPFDVATVSADGRPVDWFRSSSDQGKHFWLKEFVSEDGTTVYFDHAAALRANTPYIVAVPGSKWGEAWDLTGRELCFEATDVSVPATVTTAVSGNSFKFVGTAAPAAVSSGYVLDDAGRRFERTEAAVAPFRAWFQPVKLLDGAVKALAIGSAAGAATAMEPVAAPVAADGTVYTLSGQRASRPAKKGLYVAGGKKIVIK